MPTATPPSSWLGPSLAVALLWAPLPGMAAVWFAVQAERTRPEGDAAFRAAAARARMWVLIAVAFGLLELVAFGSVGVIRLLLASVQGGW